MNSVTASFSCMGSRPGGSGLGPMSSEPSSESSYFEGNEGPMVRLGRPDDKEVCDGNSGFMTDILDRCKRISGGNAGP